MDIRKDDFPSSQGEENKLPNSEPSFTKEKPVFEEEEKEQIFSTNKKVEHDASGNSEVLNQNSTNISLNKINLDDFKNPEYDNDANNFPGGKSESEESDTNDVVVVQVGEEIIQSQVKVTPNKGLVFLDEQDEKPTKSKIDKSNCHNDCLSDDQHNSSCSDDNSYNLVEISTPMETNIRSPVIKLGDDVFSNTLKLRAICEEREKIFNKKFEIYGLDIPLNKEITDIKLEFNRVITTIKGWDTPNKEDNNENVINDDEPSDDNIQDIAKKLTLTIIKSDFKEMNVVGQFNLGFIITTKRNKQNKKIDLFIIDQHASDEKYNFEMLQKETIFKSQRLIVPEKLELNIIDELTTLDNIEVLEKNGFKLQVNEDAEPGSRIQLISKPTSKNTTFGIDDLYELISMIREHDGIRKDYIRCSKIRSMFAMRACRMSIMVGKPLNRKTMKKVVGNLSTLDKPWNCPHGRPTMKHLLELNEWNSFTDDYNI